MKKNRRSFIKKSAHIGAGIGLLGMQPFFSACSDKTASAVTQTAAEEVVAVASKPWFNISLAQWSLHKSFFSSKLDHLDFARKTKMEFGLNAIEYVNQFFKDKAKNKNYLNEMNLRASDIGVKQLLIMIDGEGGLGDPDNAKRKIAIENHYKWVEAAKHLGCHSIRVNAFGVGSAEEVGAAAVDGLGRLSTFAKDYNINVIVENHGSYSSDGKWLSGVMKSVDMSNCGTLPDFGNFCIKRENGEPWGAPCVEEYDRYLGVKELMPYAKAVSAKTFDFDENGDDTQTDFLKMMKIVKNAGFKGWVGIEYEGSGLKAEEGIQKTIDLLRKVRSLTS